MSLTAAIHQKATGDATLAALLAAYKGAPAFFTTDPAPADAVLPYCVTSGAVAAVPFDTKQTTGFDVYRDIRCYAPKSGSMKRVEDIAERVRALFHRTTLTVYGQPSLWVTANPPRTGPEEPDAYGLIVRLRVVTSPA